MSITGRSVDVRRGAGLLDVAVVIFILVVLAAISIPRGCGSRETARGNTCRNNMRGLATALFNNSIRTGSYPGYMNVLQRVDGKVFVDPATGSPTPVSWAVMILPDIDRAALFDVWRGEPNNIIAKSEAVTDASNSTNASPLHIYIDQFLCPSDPQSSKAGTPLSFVVNTGLPDAPTAVIDSTDPTRSTPRDWAANGMFFDHFSEHPLVKPDPEKRGPMVLMKDEMVRDRKDRTILLTENVDAGNYAFASEAGSRDGWTTTEIEVGCIWRPGTFEGTGKPPQLKPPVASLQPNVELGKGDGKSYDHCRPSSRHPQSVNVAFVEQNVMPLRDTISYFVYAKLMSSDDAGVAPAGRPRDEATISAMDPHGFLRDYELTEGDINP